VFLFLGPTGVGKTELAKSLAKFLFGSESSIIQLDMSEYMEEHSVAKLIGSPPGYVGYEEEGQLTGKLRTKPYSVVLLDEIEKAHPRVSDMFLQVLDEGHLTDAKGRRVDFRNCIVVMTSNVGAEHMKVVMGIGFSARTDEEKKRQNEHDQMKGKVLAELKTTFRPEFLNRIDEQIVFRSLSRDDIGRILKPMLDEVCANLKQRYKVTLKISKEAKDFIVESGYSPEYGARYLRRTVEQFIQAPLSRLITSGELKKHDSWQAKCDGKAISITPLGS